jgi:hypothetical protein
MANRAVNVRIEMRNETKVFCGLLSLLRAIQEQAGAGQQGSSLCINSF